MQTLCGFLYHELDEVPYPFNSPEQTNPVEEFQDAEVDQQVF